MSSSTSSSEALGGSASWAAFSRSLVAAAALFSAIYLGGVFLLDPYDTGRSPLTTKVGVRPQGSRTAVASRGRDPQFTAAIFGNSHIQLVNPEILREKTGIPFVSLISPGSMSKETLAAIDWFLRHHTDPPPRAVVVGIDDFWCTPDPALPNRNPFPFWLLSRSLLDYVGGLMRYDVFEEIPSRIGYLTGSRPRRTRPDGYWDYEAGYEDQGYHSRPDIRARLKLTMETGGGNSTGPFPAAAALEALMKSAPAETALILVRPPVYITALSRPGTPDGAADAACRKAFADLAARRPNSTLIDLRVDKPILHDPNLFFDHSHYRQPIARLVEDDIVEALNRLGK